MSSERESIFMGELRHHVLCFLLLFLSPTDSQNLVDLSLCVCAEKKPVPFEPRYVGDDNRLVFFFWQHPFGEFVLALGSTAQQSSEYFTSAATTRLRTNDSISEHA